MQTANAQYQDHTQSLQNLKDLAGKAIRTDTRPPVEQSLMRIGQRIEHLESIADDLIKQLAPVSGLIGSGTKGEMPRATSACPMQDRLEGLSDKIQVVSIRLTEARESLCI